MTASELSIFIVNLERERLKRERTTALFQSVQLGQAEVLRAVQGDALDDSFLNTVYCPAQALHQHGRELSRGEIGCALSHLTIYRRMAEEGIAVALVVEDDIQLTPLFRQVLDKLLQGAQPGGWEVILLGHHTQFSRHRDAEHSLWYRHRIDDRHVIRRPAEIALGAYGYLVTLEGAQKLLRSATTIDRPIDHYTGDDQCVNTYALKPSIIKIDDYLTTHHSSMADRQSLLDKTYSTPGTLKKVAQKLGVYSLLNGLRLRLFLAAKQLRRLRPLRPYL